MKGVLRSWKLCGVSPQMMDGVPGWRKWRLKRAAWLIPPGNLFLNAMGSGCEMAGTGWAQHEVTVFNRTHGEDVAAARCIDAQMIWLPHLPGRELRQAPTRQGALLAFAELGRFHRLADRSIHGDPHAGNFLHDPESDRCRIIDFETSAPQTMNPSQGRARDFAILSLDLWQRGNFDSLDFHSWKIAYGADTSFCPIGPLLHDPEPRLRLYWLLLGYRRGEIARRVLES